MLVLLKEFLVVYICLLTHYMFHLLSICFQVFEREVPKNSKSFFLERRGLALSFLKTLLQFGL